MAIWNPATWRRRPRERSVATPVSVQLGGHRRGYHNPRTGAGTSLDASSTGRISDSVISDVDLEAAYHQSWFARAIVDYVVDDMFVLWREWDEDAEAMDAAERRHQIRERLSMAMKAARLYGSGLLAIFTREAPLDEPLAVDAIRPGDLLNLYPTRPADVQVMDMVVDPADARFGEPLEYHVQIGGYRYTLHGSRVLRFDHGTRPVMAPNARWGRSALEGAYSAAVNDLLIAQSIGHLSQESSMLTLKLKGLHEKVAVEGLDGSLDRSPSISETVEAFRANKSIHRVNVMDADDDLERTEVRWQGADRIYDVVLDRMSAISGLPRTRLLGQSPAGMNATGESDMRNYAMTIAARQSAMLTEPLRVLDAVLAMDAGLSAVPSYRFVPLTDMTDAERATTAGDWASALTTALAAGLIDEDEGRDVLAASGLFGDLEGPAPELDDLALVNDGGGDGEGEGVEEAG